MSQGNPPDIREELGILRLSISMAAMVLQERTNREAKIIRLILQEMSDELDRIAEKVWDQPEKPASQWSLDFPAASETMGH